MDLLLLETRNVGYKVTVSIEDFFDLIWTSVFCRHLGINSWDWWYLYGNVLPLVERSVYPTLLVVCAFHLVLGSLGV